MPPEPDGGLSTAARLRRRHPDLGLLFLSHYAEAHYLLRILQIGTEAIGYRLKEKVGSVEVLSDTLTRLHQGEIVIEPPLAQRLADRPSGDKRGVVASLSERELDVLRLMAEGRSNNGIAAQLFVTPKAVEKHIASIFAKLSLRADTAEHHRRVLAVLTYLRSQQDGGSGPWRALRRRRAVREHQTVMTESGRASGGHGQDRRSEEVPGADR